LIAAQITKLYKFERERGEEKRKEIVLWLEKCDRWANVPIWTCFGRLYQIGAGG